MPLDDATLTVRLCELVGSIAGYTWRPDSPYAADEVGVFYGAIPADPDRAVGIRVYGIDDERLLHLRRVQVRLRGGRMDPRGADELAGPIFIRFDRLSRWGGISGIRRDSMAPLGADENGREERTENYTITLDNEEALT